MKKTRKFTACLCVITSIIALVAGCKSDTEPDNKTESKSDVQTAEQNTKPEIVRKEKADTPLWSEYGDMTSVWKYEPMYSDEQWMDEDGKLLFPYRATIGNAEKFGDYLANLYISHDVLIKASTEDLLEVVCDGWIGDSVGNAFAYSTPFDYVSYCTGVNAAANEIFLREDMVDVVLNDYISRSYSEDVGTAKKYASILQFEEIILGSDYAFDQMDDATKDKVLTAVLDKIANTPEDVYQACNRDSGFFVCAKMEETEGEGKWIGYINQNGSEAVKTECEKHTDIWL